jgi:membrane protease YdiL (CAAX protease family)
VLPEKPWNLEAIARLLLSVLACVFAGSVAATSLYVFTHSSQFPWRFFVVASLALAAIGITLSFLRKPWAWEGFLGRAILCLGALYVGLLCALWAESIAHRPANSISSGQMMMSLLFFQGAALLLIHRFLSHSKMSWSEAFGFSNRWTMAIMWGIIVGVLFYQVGDLLQRLSVTVMTRLPIPVKPEEQQAVQTIRKASSTFDQALLAAGTVILAPLAEELLFRGILYPALKRAGFPRLSVWITSFLFAAIHVNVATFVPLFVLALTLVILYEYTGNLLAPIVAHALFNALNFSKIFTAP